MRYIKFTILIWAMCCANITRAQHRPNVQLAAAYAKQVKANSGKRLVEIVKVAPSIKLDIRYATTNNFMHRVIYSQARAFARAPVVQALKLVQADLNKKGLGLKIFDSYRPYAVTVAFYKMKPDTNFVADPQFGSKHNRGCAIDLTVINLKTGQELDMGTGFDSFSRKAAAFYAGLTNAQTANREILRTAMQAHGFTVLHSEWWHFDFNGWQQQELLDVSFRDL